MSNPDDELTEIRAFAESLGYCTDDAVLQACLKKVENMKTRIDLDPAGWDSGEHMGEPSTDEYNALLDVYESPRKERRGGPLECLSFAIKDHISVKGLQMTGGVEEGEHVSAYDAVLVERLLDAGASIVGKANMDALAIGPEGVWSEQGDVRHSFNPALVPGGSSSGSAVAVATGLVDVGIGTDAGGSVRKPAAYNELVGVKPTQGVVPNHGKILTQTTLGSIGPIARDVSTAAAVLEVISGPDRRDPGAANVKLGSLTESLDDPLDYTIGVPDSFFTVADDDVSTAVRDTIDRLVETTDCTVQSVDIDNGVSSLPSFVSNPEFRWFVQQQAINHGPGVSSDAGWYDLFETLRKEGFNEHVTLRKLSGAFLEEQTDGKSYIAGHQQIIEFQQSYDAVFDDVDIVITPTVPTVPPERSQDIENLPQNLSINCQPFNVAGAPAVSVPIGRIDGLPVSAQVAAAPFEDELTLHGARAIEQLHG